MSNLPQIKPEWLKIKAQRTDANIEVEQLLKDLKLNTVCEEAACPNCSECFSNKTATFMILGRNCTRNCTFCNVIKANPSDIDADEPKKIALAVNQLNLQHIVITSVTRDDLEDGGAKHFASCIKEIRNLNNNVIIEVLIPDFKGDKKSLEIVAEQNPNIINHNIETVKRLYLNLRPMAIYERSLELISRVKKINPNIATKSGLMVGVGETNQEVKEVIRHLYENNCEILTIGQYLAPSKNHYKVFEYVHPDIFEQYKQYALELGFKYVASAPFVRSSYLAKDAYDGFSGK